MNSYNSSYNKGSYNFHYQKDNKLVAYSTESERAVFYRKTYTHVALAILAFILVETVLLHLVPVELIEAMFGRRFIWLLIIGGFWLGSVMAAKWKPALPLCCCNMEKRVSNSSWIQLNWSRFGKPSTCSNHCHCTTAASSKEVGVSALYSNIFRLSPS